MREDIGSTSERDAQLWESRRAQPDTDAPTLAECERDEAECECAAEVRGIRFRVEVACDGYAALYEPDVPDEYGDALAYIGGAADAARAIREALNGEPS